MASDTPNILSHSSTQVVDHAAMLLPIQSGEIQNPIYNEHIGTASGGGSTTIFFYPVVVA